MGDPGFSGLFALALLHGMPLGFAVGLLGGILLSWWVRAEKVTLIIGIMGGVPLLCGIAGATLIVFPGAEYVGGGGFLPIVCSLLGIVPACILMAAFKSTAGKDEERAVFHQGDADV